MALEVIPFRDKAPLASSYEEVWDKLPLSSQHQTLWEQTRAAALYALPFVTDVWYNMMVDQDGQTAWFTDKVPIAATDDTLMYLNPATFFAYTLEERVFICSHEVMHCVFNHCGLSWNLQEAGEVRYTDGVVLPYFHKLFNIAADCVINAMLIKSGITGMPTNGQLHKLVSADDTVLDAYRKLYKEAGGGRRGKNPGDGPGNKGNGENGGEGFDVHLRPGQGRGKSPSAAEVERSPQKWINAINAAMESARMAGNLPANIERAFTKIIQVEVDWLELYPTTVSKAIGRDLLSWMYLDPEYMVRGIGFPGRIKHGCGTIVIIFDTSGSIGQKTIDMFASVTQSVIEMVRPQLCIVGECDTKVYRFDEIEDISDLHGKVRGGGGTSFCPPFDKVKEEGLDPELFIYLTDLEGDAPTEPPPYPVIWACITDLKGPWGTTIKIPKQVE